VVPRPGWYENGFKGFMKRIGPVILSVFCLLLLLNCSPATISVHRIAREWMLISFKDYTKENLMRNQARIDLTAPAENGKIKANVFVGCNHLFFKAVFKENGTTTFSDIGSTLMACPEMKLEDDFSKSLKQMQEYRLEGHFLILNDHQGNSMKFIASDWD